MSNLIGKAPRTPAVPGAKRTEDPVPGKHTQVEHAYAATVQRAPRGTDEAASPPRASGGADDAASVQAAAVRGAASPSSPLPFRDAIQRAFGRHDISSIQAHTGSEAQASAQAMGADAYATGNHVVLGKQADLFTAAHEAAHVVQQRGGVQLKGGVGEAGDAYEQHADEVAARVVDGGSAEALLDRHAGGRGSTPPGPGADGAIQRRVTLQTPPPTLPPTIEGGTGPGTDGYHLMSQVNLRIDAMHFTRTAAAQAQVQNWVSSPQHTVFFDDVDHMVNRLFEMGHLQRTVRGAAMGPRNLGSRPGFTGAAAQMATGPGEHRRHVISSSTLGKAIENSRAPLTDVNRFLGAHGGAQVHGNQPIDLRNAKRNAWHLVHNHCGNLWAGPGPANSMIGFIRSPLTSRADALAARNEPQIARTDPGLQMPLPQGASAGSPAEAHWNYVTGIATGMLDEITQHGQLNPHEAAQILREVIANCDLDLPPERDNAYFHEAYTIYIALITNPDVAFAPGGALDRFMALDHQNHPAPGGGSDMDTSD